MEENKSHKQILKSTGIVGGAQVLSIIIGVVRTKVIALLLGPAGIGIAGILQSTIDIVRNATGFGINFSGVKDIAEANGTADKLRIARTITIVRRWALGTGILGMLVTLALCIPLSDYAFGNDSYALSIATLSVILVITSISAGQLALLQGLRQITQLAKATLYGAFIATTITLPLYWWLGIDGIVPAMLITALIALIISWFFTRRIKVVKPKLTVSETFNGGLSMMKLGFFIVITGFMATVTMYIVRAFVAKEMSIDAVGYFQASWVITNSYIGIVLNAMLADFFPRLSAINTDNIASNKLINEQMEMAFLLGAPLLITMLGLSFVVIEMLYSSLFVMAVPILQWQIAGSIITLIAWPIGVMFLAKSKGIYCIITDGLWSALYIIFVIFGWNYFGFNILGIAYVWASFAKLLSVWFSARRLGKFAFSKTNIKYITVFALISMIMLVNVSYLNGYLQYVISTILSICAISYSYRKLKTTIDIKGIINSKLLRR